MGHSSRPSGAQTSGEEKRGLAGQTEGGGVPARRKRLLVFHPIIAPYRIDFFNSLAGEYDAEICLTWRNLHDQTFDYAKIEEQFDFVPTYLDRRTLKVIPSGIFRKIREFRPDVVMVSECGLIPLLVLLHRSLTRGGTGSSV